MARTLRTLAVAALTWSALAATSSFAQEGGGGPEPARPQDDGTKPPPAPPKAPDAPSLLDPQECLSRMTRLHARTARRPSAVPGAETQEERAARAKAEADWKNDVRAFAKAGDDYVRAIGDGAPEADALFYRGLGQSLLADLLPAREVPAACDAAIDALRRYLDAAAPESAFRTDAQRHLGWCLVRTNRLDDALPHLSAAVAGYQAQGRRDEAGKAAYDAMNSLKSQDRLDDLAAFAETIDAAKSDFGASTPSIRLLLAASQLAVGKPLPALPAVKDTQGNEVSWKPGKPLLLHFFVTNLPDGSPTAFREIELEIRPLVARFREKGLAAVGVAMDYELPREKAEQTKKNWEEWGVKREFRDGSLATVRSWAARQEIDWPWVWDGKWLNNPVSRALGGVGVSEPYAVLADKDGIVRWHGKAPFTGLPEAVEALLPR